jgi:hypothetical protein
MKFLKDFTGRYIKGRFKLKTAVLIILIPVLLAGLFAGIRYAATSFFHVNNDEMQFTEKTDSFDIEIDISDFIFPESITNLDKFNWVPYRGVKEKWSSADVAEFWINPEIIVNEEASEKNRKNIKKLFESIP